MDSEKLRASAEKLNGLLVKASEQGSVEAAELLSALRPLLELVEAGQLTAPLQWGQVPGDVMFSETVLRDIAGLEQAFAEFKIQVTGQEGSAALEWLRSQQ